MLLNKLALCVKKSWEDTQTSVSWPNCGGSDTQSTYIPRVPQCLSPRPNRNPPPPPASKCAPSPEPKLGAHTWLRVSGWGCPNSDDWRKSLALCLLFGRI